MIRNRLKTPHKTKCFTLMRHPVGVLVADRLAKRCYVVCVNSGRFVGNCTCGSTATDPWDSCRHQNAVRSFLMDYCFRRRPRLVGSE
jgi:hypothetical protein